MENDARGGLEKDKYIIHDLLDSVLNANGALALLLVKLAQMLRATLSGVVDLNVIIRKEEFGGRGCS